MSAATHCDSHHVLSFSWAVLGPYDCSYFGPKPRRRACARRRVEDPSQFDRDGKPQGFSVTILEPLNREAKSADAFIADTIALETGRAVQAIQRMRLRFKKPELSPDQLLLEMEARDLTETVDVLRPYVLSI